MQAPEPIGPGDLEHAGAAPGSLDRSDSFLPPGGTLDESLWATFSRDLFRIGKRMTVLLWPLSDREQREALVCDWELWGPAMIILLLASLLTILSPASQHQAVFSVVFMLLTAGSAVVTLNAKLLGGSIDILQALSMLGYSSAPFLLVPLVHFVFQHLLVQLVCVLAAGSWSWLAAHGLFVGIVEDNKRLLALYPLGLFLFALGWIAFMCAAGM